MFESLKGRTGAAKLQHPAVIAGIIILSVILSFIIAKGGMLIAAALIGLLPALVFLNRVFNKPSVSIVTLLVFSFVAIGLTRYLVGVPLGLGIDGLLVLTYIAIFFRNFYGNLKIDQANRDITYLLTAWFAYAILELFNPLALSKTAWFYAMRGMSMYPILLVPLALMLLKDSDGYIYSFIYGQYLQYWLH